MTEIEVRRKEKGFTQQYMAEKIDVSIGCYNMYENNQRKVPVEKAEKIVEILNCKMDDIFVPSSFSQTNNRINEKK